MNPDTIRETLFGTPWHRCSVQLSSGETYTLDHHDWAFMSPTNAFLIVVFTDSARGRDSYRVIEPDHIASLHIERQPKPQSKPAASPWP